jgi:hypothetical protein
MHSGKEICEVANPKFQKQVSRRLDPGQPVPTAAQGGLQRKIVISVDLLWYKQRCFTWVELPQQKESSEKS